MPQGLLYGDDLNEGAQHLLTGTSQKIALVPLRQFSHTYTHKFERIYDTHTVWHYFSKDLVHFERKSVSLSYT